ncbi:hypothetical protein JCM30204_23180 [Dysgonomonas termitidis]
MFQLTDEEMNYWKSQIVMSNSVNMGVRRKPYAFSELGVAMLSSVLNSKTAIQINIGIMRAFVAVRQLLAFSPINEVKRLQDEVKGLKAYIEEVFADYNDINEDNQKSFDEIYVALSELAARQNKQDEPKPRKPVGYIKPKE